MTAGVVKQDSFTWTFDMFGSKSKQRKNYLNTNNVWLTVVAMLMMPWRCRDHHGDDDCGTDTSVAIADCEADDDHTDEEESDDYDEGDDKEEGKKKVWRWFRPPSY